jgi:hypothetical protein
MTGMLTIGGALPVALIFAFGIVYLNYLGLTKHCAGCGRRTSTKALSEIGCPECGQLAVKPGAEGTRDIAPVLERPRVCCQCGLGGELSHAWDNRDYCQACLYASGFSAEDIQAMNTPLREMTKPSLGSTCLACLSIYALIAVGITAGFFAFALIVSKRLDAALQVAMVITILFAPAAITFGVGKCIAMQIYPSTVWAWNGHVGLEEQGACELIDISHCTWSFGNAASGIADPLSWKMKRRCILFRTSEQPARGAGKVIRIPVGFDPAKRALWERFLNLASVPHSE